MVPTDKVMGALETKGEWSPGIRLGVAVCRLHWSVNVLDVVQPMSTPR